SGRGLQGFTEARQPGGAVHRRRAGAVRPAAEGADRGTGGQQEAGGALHGAGNAGTGTVSKRNPPSRRVSSLWRCVQAPLAERGATGWLSLEMVTSTRR